MKNNLLLVIIAAIVFLQPSCSNDNNGNNNLDGFTTDLCNAISGPTAGYYAYAHGEFLPLTQIPTIANPGQAYIHSQYPPLGFTVPQGYTAFDDQFNLGVNVIKNDNQVVWRYVPSLSIAGQVAITDIVAAEVNGMFDFYNHTGNFDVVCTHNITQQLDLFLANFSTRLIRFGNFTGQVVVNTLFDTTTGFTYGSVSLASAPTAEYEDRIMDVFLPIHWQLLVIDDNVRDTDLDGTPDNQDNFPFDPDRQ